jgi:hypothetical protein
MTMNEIEPYAGGENSPRQTYSWSQAKQGRLTSHKIYTLIAELWRLVVTYHRQASTPRDRWEPTELAGHLLVGHYAGEAAELVGQACERNLDPELQKIEDMGAEIETTVAMVSNRDTKLISSETGIVYTETAAVTQVEQNQYKVIDDVKRGRAHHKRVPAWLRALGKLMPYGETLGLVVLLTFFLNVEWTQPWADPLTWTVAVVVVLATLLFTPRVVERAAEGWNKRREAVAQNQEDAQKKATRKLATNGIIAWVVSLALVAGLVERALAVADDSMPESMLILIISLCVIAGLAMPAIAFIAVAWDGSTISRETENLVKQLGEGLAEDQNLRGTATALDQACGQVEFHLSTHLVPTIVQLAANVAEEAHTAYAWLWVQIGGLPSAPPTRPCHKLIGDEAVAIDTGIPGAELIRLEPLIDRGIRLRELGRRRSELMAQLNAVPPHPWSG